DLQLALVDVLEILRRTHDRVHDRADVGEERGDRCAPDQKWVVEAPRGVRIRPVDERDPDHEQEEDEEIDRQVEAVVRDSKEGEGHRIPVRAVPSLYPRGWPQKPSCGRRTRMGLSQNA